MRETASTAPEGLVTVVIPAFNAARTLARTIESVCAQTWRNIEVIVVDDGSTDATPDIAEAAARRDGRVRLLRKSNGGVADARNTGVRAGAGDLVAPIDADDLWRPERIAMVATRMRESGEDVGAVYNLSRDIDPDDRVIGSRGLPSFEGSVFLRSVLVNFVGNGSALAFRRSAFDAVGGYPTDRAVQSAEDWLFQTLLARHWRYAACPLYLTGYRRWPGGASSNALRQKRAKLAAITELRRRAPDAPSDICALIEADTRLRIGLAEAARGRLSVAAHDLSRALMLSPTAAFSHAGLSALRGVSALTRRLGGRTGSRPDFAQLDPATPGARFSRGKTSLLSRVAAREAEFVANGVGHD